MRLPFRRRDHRPRPVAIVDRLWADEDGLKVEATLTPHGRRTLAVDLNLTVHATAVGDGTVLIESESLAREFERAARYAGRIGGMQTAERLYRDLARWTREIADEARRA